MPKDDDKDGEKIKDALKKEAMGKGPIKDGLKKIQDKIEKKGKGDKK